MKIKLLALTLVAIASLALIPHAFAQSNIRSGDSPALAASEVINSDYFAAGQTVSVQGTVNGDAYVAGGNINITGTINGDLLAAGGNITITGTVTGNIRAAGGTLLLNGKTGRNITLAGGNISLSPEASVTGSGVVAGGNISLLGAISKGLTLAGGEATIGNQIGGDINAGVEKLALGPGAHIQGNLSYWSENTATLDPQASVSGHVTQNITPKKQTTPEKVEKKALVGIFSFFQIISFLSALLLGLLIIKLFPNYMQQTALIVKERYLLSIGLGLLALAVTPLLLIFLIVTLVGIPLAVAWLFFLIAAIWLSKIFIAMVMGNWLIKFFNQKTSLYLAFTIGLLAYYLLMLIPIVGWLVGCIVYLLGLGAVLVSKREYYLDLRKKELI